MYYMFEKVAAIPDLIIRISFYLLFFIVPLVLTPYNYELFEYNKMMTVYFFTVLITGCWIVKMISNKEIKIARTPWDFPIFLFLISQIISTIFSIDRHVSIFGYYSRFNGGLLSTLSYILLYYAFVTNFPKEKINKLLFVVLSSGFLVSIYGILEHFGIDRDLWVQDVQNRVFSTLGQPNWLAAYLAVLIPVTIGIIISKIKYQIANMHIINQNYLEFSMYFLSLIFYICILFTKSRSGFIGVWISLSLMWLLLLNKYKSKIFKQFLILNSLFLILIFLLGSPFSQINRFTLNEITKTKQTVIPQDPVKPLGTSLIETGITGSGTIRNIVWSGAIDIFKHNPIIGTGPETFAFSYYKFRPIEHNITSEWDFLYNKAHNEYLNFAATTGVLGLGSYLLIIGGFIWWNFKQFKNQRVLMSSRPTSKYSKGVEGSLSSSEEISHMQEIPRLRPAERGFARNDIRVLQIALFSAWLSILMTNFFGFSVVIIQLFFYLIPAITYLFAESSLQYYQVSFSAKSDPGILKSENLNILQKLLVILLLFVICYMFYVLGKMWYADVIFAEGFRLSKSQKFSESYESIHQALKLNSLEPFYYDELSYPAAELSVALELNGESTLSASLQNEAILASTIAVATSPNNVNFWKTRTRVFYALSQLGDQYLADAAQALSKAKELSPTDPKIHYNLALLYDQLDKKAEAIMLLEETTRLKSNYRDAYFALALFYTRDNHKEKAEEALNFILTRINPNDEEARKQLEEIK